MLALLGLTLQDLQQGRITIGHGASKGHGLLPHRRAGRWGPGGAAADGRDGRPRSRRSGRRSVRTIRGPDRRPRHERSHEVPVDTPGRRTASCWDLLTRPAIARGPGRPGCSWKVRPSAGSPMRPPRRTPGSSSRPPGRSGCSARPTSWPRGAGISSGSGRGWCATSARPLRPTRYLDTSSSAPRRWPARRSGNPPPTRSGAWTFGLTDGPSFELRLLEKPTGEGRTADETRFASD